jgi:hypothetical protein
MLNVFDCSGRFAILRVEIVAIMIGTEVILQFEQFVSRDTPDTSYAKGWDQALLAPPPGGNSTDAQVICDLVHRQQLIKLGTLFALG